MIALLEPYGQRLDPQVDARPPTPRAGSSSCSRRSAATPRSRARRCVPRLLLARQARSALSSPRSRRVRRWSGLPVDLLAPEQRSTRRDRDALAPAWSARTTRARRRPRDRAPQGRPRRSAAPGRRAPVRRPDRRRQDRARQAARALPVRRRRPAGARRHERDHDAVGDRAPHHAVARGHVARRSHPPPAALGRAVRRDREGRRRRVRPVARRARRRPADRRVRSARRFPHVADRDDDEPRRHRSAPRRLLVGPDAAPDPTRRIKTSSGPS